MYTRPFIITSHSAHVQVNSNTENTEKKKKQCGATSEEYADICFLTNNHFIESAVREHGNIMLQTNAYA
jgi:hypothetical protein